MKKFCFLVSGGGGPLRFFYYAIEVLNLPFKIVSVIGDRECGALDFAQVKGIPSKQVSYSRQKGGLLIDAIGQHTCDFIITNFNKIIGQDVLDSTNARFINVHPSLLPAYSGMIGMKTVDCAKADNAMFLGATCHNVIERVDAGKILQQVAFSSDWTLPVSAMYDKTFRAVCLSLLNVFMNDHQEDMSQANEFIFNPKCKFDISLFDEAFWTKIRMGV